MERAIRLTNAARLHAVGVIGLAPMVHAYHPYPAGALKAMRPANKRPMNPAIHATVGSKPNYCH